MGLLIERWAVLFCAAPTFLCAREVFAARVARAPHRLADDPTTIAYMHEGAEFPTRAARILVVDDQLADRGLLVDYLRTLGHRLYVADNGRSGFELANFLGPDLILLDVRMPVCDGIACCRLLKASGRTASIPAIFLSAAALPQERVQGLAAGAVDYITKPFDFDEVRLRVAIHLSMARAGADAGVHPSQAAGSPAATAGDAGHSLDAVVFRAARRMLMQDLSATPDLASLARTVGTNPKRLNDAFRRFTGTTAFEYLREIRMAQARRLLVETRLEIQTIASDLGYGSAANFATAFRERFGMTPSQYRREPGESAPSAPSTADPSAALT
jgi:DNA-binding response OmpR family regulator